jgi:mannose-6-phosphate isomerase-like protein (cupin superfamily)
MDARSLDSFSSFSNEKLKKLNVFETGHFFLDVYCLKPGQFQKAHAHGGSDKVYVVLQGTCRFTVGGEAADYGPNTAILAPAGVSHGVENSGSADARLLVMITPPPE